MTHVTVQPYGDAAPRTQVLSLENGESFVTVNLGTDVSVILPGHDGEAIDYIAALIEVLQGASNVIAERLDPAPSLMPMETFAEMDARIAGEMAREEA